MSTENDKKLLEDEIESLNEEIKSLGYQLSGLLNVDCNFGLCLLDPDVGRAQDKIREVQEKKALLQRIKKNIDSCLK